MSNQKVFVRIERSIYPAELLKENKKTYSVFIPARGFHSAYNKKVNKEDVIFPNEKFVLVHQYWRSMSVISCRIERKLYSHLHDYPGEFQPQGFAENHDPALTNAIVKSHDEVRYYENQQLHRLDGPAIERNKNHIWKSVYWFHGKQIDADNLEDFQKQIKLMILE